MSSALWPGLLRHLCPLTTCKQRGKQCSSPALFPHLFSRFLFPALLLSWEKALTNHYIFLGQLEYFCSSLLSTPPCSGRLLWSLGLAASREFQRQPRGRRELSARSQEGENQFTTDLFLTASQLLDEVLALPTAGRADAAWTGQGMAAQSWQQRPSWDSVPVPDSV